ncbi:MAG TPA: porin [Albitalea sp.]|nr:porin [Albitalea sp.]
MRQIVAVAALAVSAPVVMAQSSVQVYGILDAGISRTSGITGGTKTLLVSGIMEGSRLGFKGNEDLGGGFRALFTMEHRFETDTGAISNRPESVSKLPDRLSQAGLLGLPGALQPVVNSVAATIGSTVGVNLAGNMWDRQVFVGLVTPVGAVLAGRQYTPAYEVSAAFDTLATQSSLSAGQVASFPPSIDIRVSNALAYRLQQGPLSGAFMYALGEGSATTGRLIGISGMYKSDAFSAGIGYNSRNNERKEKSLTSIVIGASAAIGPGTLVGEMASVKDDHPTGLSSLTGALTPVVGAATAGVVQNAYVQALKQDARLLHVGYRMTTGPHTFYVAYSSLNDRRPANADVASYGGVYTYSFSKRTDVNLVLTHFNNKGLAQAAPGQAGFVGGFTDTAGTDSNNVALGLRHRF